MKSIENTCQYLSASSVVIHYEEALYQVYGLYLYHHHHHHLTTTTTVTTILLYYYYYHYYYCTTTTFGFYLIDLILPKLLQVRQVPSSINLPKKNVCDCWCEIYAARVLSSYYQSNSVLRFLNNSWHVMRLRTYFYFFLNIVLLIM